jgi:hypothetical protein
MERVKNVALVFCLFIVLLVIFSSYFRATAIGSFFGALAGTPLLTHAFNRMTPRRPRLEPENAIAQLAEHAESMPRPTEQVVVLRMERPNGRT